MEDDSITLETIDVVANQQNMKYPLEDQLDYKAKVTFVLIDDGALVVSSEEALNQINDKTEQSKGTLTQATSGIANSISSLKNSISNTIDTASNAINNATDTVSNVVNDVSGAVSNITGGLVRIDTSSINKARSALMGTNLPGVGSTKKAPKRPKTIGPKIQLYLPQSIQLSSSMSYENIDLGRIGGSVQRATEGGADVVGAVGSAFVSSYNTVADLFSDKEMSEQAKRMVAVASQKLTSGGSTNISSGITSGNRIQINPNTKAIFKSVAIREFSFTFKMIATSQAESQEITRIIKYFREEMHPESFNVSDDIDIPLGYIFPNRWQIKFTYNTDEIATQIKPCYLRNCNVVYNSGSMGMHQDGSFTEVDITLSFAEDRALSKQDIREGY